MSLTTLIRKAAFGIALTVGCGSSENKFDRAFDTAQEELERRGIEVRGGLWNKEDQYTQLSREMRYDLGEAQSALSRRYGANSCDEVGLSSYDPSVFYCGPGAVQGNCDRVAPGNCLNEVCFEHDGEYENLLYEENRLCLWSGQTRDIDERFFRGYDRCVENDDCGFYCHLIGAIALNLAAIERGYGAVGPGCLWDGDYEQPKERNEPKEKEDKKPGYKDPPKKEKKPIDESLRELCREYYERGLIDCDDTPGSPQEIEKIIQGVCYNSSLTSLERDRARIECAYENNCDEFFKCQLSR